MAPRDSGISIPSPELDKGDFGISYNARTGRPVRKTRRVYEGSPFVDSAIAVSDASDEDSDSSTALVSKLRKRKRSPSPPTSVQSDSDKILSESGASVETSVASQHVQAGTQITISNLVINVPPGHTGPLLLQLDIPSQTSTQITAPHQKSTPTKQNSVSSTQESTPERSDYAGFLDLPAELRNEIYRLVFVTPDCFNFDTPSNFTRSAALLRTCKQVHSEGRSILYSENHFLFMRKTVRHGSYWEREWNEVGFKAVRKFLRIIGPENTALLQEMTLWLEDATPCLNPSMPTADERRFVFDEVLMEVLKLLGQHGRLRKIGLHFRGKSA